MRASAGNIAASLAMGLAIIGVLGALLQASAHAERSQDRKAGAAMEPVEIVIDRVSAWEEPATGSTAILRLRGGLALSAARGDPRYAAWQDAAVRQQQRNAPVYVEFDRGTREIKALYMSLSREVESLEHQPGGRLTVTFRRAPSFYFVSRDRQGAPEMIALLEAAARNHRAVLVVAHPSTLEILDVRRPGQ